MTTRSRLRGTTASTPLRGTQAALTGAPIRRIEPLEDVPPMKDTPQQPFPIIARLGYGADADKTGKE